MDLESLKKCKDEKDFSDLIMEDILGGYNDPTVHPDHKLIAIVDHASGYDLNRIISFFETVHSQLNVRFWVGDGHSVIIDGTKYDRLFLYSDEEPLISLDFADGIYRLREPVSERPDGITIDLKGLTISFKEHGELLNFNSEEALDEAINKILKDYWPELKHPDIVIRDSISKEPMTKWMVESIADHLMTMDSRKEMIDLLMGLEKHVPDLKFEFQSGDYIPCTAALQLAIRMDLLDTGIQNEIIKSIKLRFGFLDDYDSSRDFMDG